MTTTTTRWGAAKMRVLMAWAYARACAECALEDWVEWLAAAWRRGWTASSRRVPRLGELRVGK